VQRRLKNSREPTRNTQGLDEIRRASQEYGWDINVAEVAKIWRAGCIIRAKLLERIRCEYAAGDLVTLLEAPSIKAELARCQDAWRRVVCRTVTAGVPMPGFAAALAHYDSIRAPRVNAALTQGLRDFLVPTPISAPMRKEPSTPSGPETAARFGFD
jgi:6-phosphogluconate dehydrogenase